MSKEYLYKKIIKERINGKSLRDISKKYGVAKSTVSLWCRNVLLSEGAKNKIKNKWLKETSIGRKKGVMMNKQQKEGRIQGEFIEAINLLGDLTVRDNLMIGIALYWAEGSKKETGAGFNFINSDPLMVKFMFVWLQKQMYIAPDEIFVNLVINHAFVAQEHEILKFWSNLLDLPMKRFGNSIFIKTLHKREYKNESLYCGMLRMRVAKSSWLRRRILGSIEVVKNNMSV